MRNAELLKMWTNTNGLLKKMLPNIQVRSVVTIERVLHLSCQQIE